MSYFAVVQVEEIRRTVVRFERSEVFRAEMRVRLLARQDRKEKAQIGVVRIQQVQPAEIDGIVAWDSGEIGV